MQTAGIMHVYVLRGSKYCRSHRRVDAESALQTSGIMRVCLRLHLTSHHQRQRRRLQVGSQTTALPSRLAGCLADSALLFASTPSTSQYWHAGTSWVDSALLNCRLFLLYSLNVLLLLKIGMLGRLCSTGLFLLYSLLLLLLLLKIGILLYAE